jgi:hypothetical protein
VFVSGRPLSYTEEEARQAIEASLSWAETLRRLGLCPTGGAWRVIQKHAARWGIASDHFLRQGRPPAARRALDEILVENSPVRGTKLKERLYREGVKSRICEICGQAEDWHGRHMALILDHINGVRDDNRLENLRIVCANCNATLETHCGRQTRIVRDPRTCVRCETIFVPRHDGQTHCSRYCGSRHTNRYVPPQRADRPPLEELLKDIATIGYEAIGRVHGVTGNAVRNWVKAYGVDPPAGGGRGRLSAQA